MKSEGEPMARSEELGMFFIKVIYNQNLFSHNATLAYSNLIFNFVWGRALPGEHKLKITYREEDWVGKPNF